jgi:hypothetical protein
MSSPIEFAVIGGGWRAEFFLRVAQALPERFTVVGVTTRRADRSEELRKQFGVEVYSDPAELLASTKPSFVVTSVPRAVSPEMIKLAVDRDVPVLAETPPAGSLEAMAALWKAVGTRGHVQVAEQYPFQPLHAARLAFLASGKIGRPTYMQVSVAHGYHAMVLVRKALRIGFENPLVTGRKFTSPLVAGPNRAGPPTSETVADVGRDLVFYDFGDRLVLYDFTGAQYFSYIRRLRMLVQGERGELVDDQATYLADFRTPIHVNFTRHEAGRGGNLEGFHLKGIQADGQWIYTNPLAPARLADDEIAVGTTLLQMDRYVRTGESFYSLAEACQDAYLELLATEALSTGKSMQATSQPWSQS